MAFRPERLAGRAVLTLISRLVNIALIVQFLEDFLNRFYVIIVRRTDKFIVGYIEQIPEFFDVRDALVHELLGRFARLFRFFLDFLSVFVRTGKIENVEPAHALIARDRVATNRGITVSEVPVAARIINGRGDVVCLFIHVSLRKSLFYRYIIAYAPKKSNRLPLAREIF